VAKYSTEMKEESDALASASASRWLRALLRLYIRAKRYAAAPYTEAMASNEETGGELK